MRLCTETECPHHGTPKSSGCGCYQEVRNIERIAVDMELFLWATAAAPAYGSDTEAVFDFTEVKGQPGPEITVPMKGHLPDTAHMLWPSVRNALEAVRLKMELSP